MYKSKSCGVCGEGFTPSAPCNLYCSDVCKVSAKRAAYNRHLASLRSGVGSGGNNLSGRDHPKFRSGKGFLDKNRHRFKEMIRFCESCGKDLLDAKGKNSFCVHHKDHNRANNPEDFSNWALLCPRCHHLEHDKQANLNVQRLSQCE